MYDISIDQMVSLVQDWLSTRLTHEPDDLFAYVEAERLLGDPDWVTPDLALSWLDFIDVGPHCWLPLIPDV